MTSEELARTADGPTDGPRADRARPAAAIPPGARPGPPYTPVGAANALVAELPHGAFGLTYASSCAARGDGSRP
ncbi:hypothetical protein [Streptomyces sp. NPDC017940]|uniref:hypothetical protein n=1 Tax=Streptomyces sp. NPDC017940 TaxID=3365017 RepID=UPI0037A86CF0